jgi:hypothetical protein
MLHTDLDWQNISKNILGKRFSFIGGCFYFKSALVSKNLKMAILGGDLYFEIGHIFWVFKKQFYADCKIINFL